MTELVFEPLNGKDIAIAEVYGGDFDEQVIWLHGEKCCDNCSPRCQRKPCCKDCFGGGCKESLDGGKDFRIVKGCMAPVAPQGKPENIFVAGPNGCGKSHWCSTYIKQYRLANPKHPVYLISYVPEDKVLDELKVIRVPLVDVLDGQINCKSIENSLIIFDDVDAEPPAPEDKEEYVPKKMFAAVEALRDQLLTTARKSNVSILVTSHLLCDFKHTKKPIHESQSIVVYPRGGCWSQIDRVLRTYCGLTQPQIDRVKTSPSRWVMIHKSYPTYVIQEKGVYLL